MKIKGYKAFNKDHTNRYGKVFEVGQEYITKPNVSFGPASITGYHMCKHLADVFRYFNSDNLSVGKVIGSGNFQVYHDEYYGYYDMYAVEKIIVIKFLTRQEIIQQIFNSNKNSIKKFLQTFALTEEEKKIFLQKFINDIEIICQLLYYQYQQTDIYKINFEQVQKRIRSAETWIK